MPLVPLSEVNPGAYAAWSAQNQPGASLQQTQQSTQTSGAEQANLQAQNPGIQAQSQTEQVAALQKKAQLGLSADLSNKMTLPAALKKYTALGISADDVFKQYLSESPYGMPNQNPQELQQLGVTPAALGQIGTPGSFMDRYNMKNAVTGLRDLKDKWNQTNALSHIPLLGGVLPSSKSYEAARQIFGQHLSSLIPGASGAQASSQALINSIPDVGDPTAPEAANGQFNSVESQLMASKGYSYKDLGISQPADIPTKSGSGLLSTLLKGAGGDIQNLADTTGTEIAHSAVRMSNPLALMSYLDPTGRSGAVLEKAGLIPSGMGSDNAVNQLKGIVGEYGKATGIGQNGKAVDLGEAVNHLENHPVNTVLDALPFLAAGKMAMAGDASKAGAVADTAQAGATKAAVSAPKINPIMNLIKPSGTVKAGGNFRNAVVSAADEAGAMVNGSTLSSDIEKWADTAKAGNLGQGKYIDQAVADAKAAFGNKNFKPSDLAKIYSEADSGYTKTGIAKTPIQANIDRGLRDILSNRLDQIAPGWQKSTDIMAKGFKTAKSPARKYAKIGATLSVGALGANAATNALKQVLGGL